VQRIIEVFVGIRNSGGIFIEDEVIWKLLRSLMPTYKTKVPAIEEIIPLTKYFNKEMLITKLTTFETA
jgi:predicted nucleic-acid-binding protein